MIITDMKKEPKRQFLLGGSTPLFFAQLRRMGSRKKDPLVAPTRKTPALAASHGNHKIHPWRYP